MTKAKDAMKNKNVKTAPVNPYEIVVAIDNMKSFNTAKVMLEGLDPKTRRRVVELGLKVSSCPATWDTLATVLRPLPEEKTVGYRVQILVIKDEWRYIDYHPSPSGSRIYITPMKRTPRTKPECLRLLADWLELKQSSVMQFDRYRIVKVMKWV